MVINFKCSTIAMYLKFIGMLKVGEKTILPMNNLIRK